MPAFNCARPWHRGHETYELPSWHWSPSPTLLAAYFDGECEGRDDLAQLKQRIEAWLTASPHAQDEVAEYRHLLQACRSTSPAEPDNAQWVAVLSRIQAQTDTERIRSVGRRSAIGWAAATVRAACLAVVLFWQPGPRIQPPAPVLAISQIEDEILPVADVNEVVIVRVEGADSQTLVVGQLPVQGVLELAAPGDVVLTKIRPDAADNMIPQVHMNETASPLIWAKLDSERD